MISGRYILAVFSKEQTSHPALGGLINPRPGSDLPIRTERGAVKNETATHLVNTNEKGSARVAGGSSDIFSGGCPRRKRGFITGN